MDTNTPTTDQPLHEFWREDIAARLRVSGIDMRTLAGALGVAPQSVQDWMNGTRPISPLRYQQALEAIAMLAATTPARAAEKNT